MNLEDMEIPATLQLRVGEMFTLTLPGLATAGYVWTYEVTQPDKAVIDVTSVNPESLLFEDGSERLPVGSSGNEIFAIRAIQRGCARLRLVQRRSWEQNRPPLKEYRIEIVVQ